MTPSYNHATLFVATSPPAEESEPGPPADDGAEAMRKLRDPFKVEPARDAEPAGDAETTEHSDPA